MWDERANCSREARNSSGCGLAEERLEFACKASRCPMPVLFAIIITPAVIQIIDRQWEKCREQCHLVPSRGPARIGLPAWFSMGTA